MADRQRAFEAGGVKHPRGTVLLGGNHHWLVWTGGRPTPLCIPLCGQSGPLSRWDVPLGPHEIPGLTQQAPIARLQEAREVDPSEMSVVAHLDAASIAQIERALRRAAESMETEERGRMS